MSAHQLLKGFKATPHKDRLTALRVPCLHLFRHIAQKFLDIRGLPLWGGGVTK